MEKLKISLDRELKVMISLQITAEEWMFIQLLFLCKEESPEYLFRYFTEAKKDVVPRAMIINLKEKGIIDKSYNIPEEGESFDPNQIPFSKEFLKEYLKSSLEQGQEIVHNFPPFVKGFPMKNITKSFRSLEDLCLAYSKAIRFSPEKHKEVIELLNWAIENELISFGLSEFVISRKWEDLKRMKDGEIPHSSLRTFDTSQII